MARNGSKGFGLNKAQPKKPPRVRPARSRPTLAAPVRVRPRLPARVARGRFVRSRPRSVPYSLPSRVADVFRLAPPSPLPSPVSSPRSSRRVSSLSLIEHQSPKARKERKKCKSRPNSKRARRGSGGSKSFVPWC